MIFWYLCSSSVSLISCSCAIILYKVSSTLLNFCNVSCIWTRDGAYAGSRILVSSADMIFALVSHSAADSMRSMLEGSHHHLSVRTRAPNNRMTIPPLYTWCLMPSGLYYFMIGKMTRNDLPIVEAIRERDKNELTAP